MIKLGVQPSLGIIGVVDAVTAQLRLHILDGTIPSGKALTEIAVSQTFGVARPSAKAAIEQLVAAGLLVRSAHRTARVSRIEAAMVHDVYRTRVRLESAALRELAATRTVPQDAVDANIQILAMGAGSDPLSVAPDLGFHTAIIDALQSERTGRMYRTVLDEVRLCMAQVQDRQLLDASVIAAQHAAILDAVRRGDGDAAAQLLHDHLSSAEERLVSALKTSQSEV